MKQYNELSKNDIDVSGFNFLVVTATDIETSALHDVMSGNISKIVNGSHTYYLGHIGHYSVIHVQCLQMGSLNPGGSTLTVSAALSDWPQIKAVIMVGICFGFDESKQQIGDVVVSSSIKNYETRRVGEKQEIPRGDTYQADRCLLNAFNNLKQTWEYTGADNQTKRLIFGEFVSGEQLVDNLGARNKLLAETPEAKAGEMEGNGLVASCVDNNKPWILVKAICDYGDGNKGVNKRQRQSIAAASAANCCAQALSQTTAFSSLGITIERDQTPIPDSEENPGVLFEIYKKEYEPFFLKRDVDVAVESYLSCHSLWIYGISGVGKSTSILHALLTKGNEPLLINMAGIGANSSLEEIFVWIYNEVALFLHETDIAPSVYQLCARKIVSLLDKHYAHRSVYVLVEEIPFEGESFKTFVNSFSSLVVSNNLSGITADVHFVLSSIENPTLHLLPNLMKIKSMVKFLEFVPWTHDECANLINLIRSNISVPTVKNTDELIAKCNLLPRHIKYVFRESYQMSNSNELDAEIVDEMLRRVL